MRTAVLGTGTMGAGMARSLARAGHEVTAWNRTAARAEPLASDGITVAGSVREAVDGADAVFTVLFDADAVLHIAGELTGALGPDAVWLQTSTVGPDGIRRIAERTGAGNLLDAPVLGTKQPAEQGTLVPLVSGPRGLVERVHPALDAIGTKTVVAGAKIGDASALKLACNAWLLSITTAAAQSVAMCRALGVDPALFLDAIDGQPVDSPYAQLKGGAMIKGDFTPSFALDGGLKDLELITAAASGAGVDAAVARAARSLFTAASEAGHGDEDLAAVIHALT